MKSEWSSSHASTWSLFIPSPNLLRCVLDRGLHCGEKNQPMPLTIGGAVTVSLRKDSSAPEAREVPGVSLPASMDSRQGIPSLR